MHVLTLRCRRFVKSWSPKGILSYLRACLQLANLMFQTIASKLHSSVFWWMQIVWKWWIFPDSLYFFKIRTWKCRAVLYLLFLIMFFLLERFHYCFAGQPLENTAGKWLRGRPGEWNHGVVQSAEHKAMQGFQYKWRNIIATISVGIAVHRASVIIPALIAQRTGAVATDENWSVVLIDSKERECPIVSE